MSDTRGVLDKSPESAWDEGDGLGYSNHMWLAYQIIGGRESRKGGRRD
jgi:hypothetical protein